MTANIEDWRMKTGRDRYFNDNNYKMLVDQMVAFIYDNKYTPSEMRDAAMTASIIHEQRCPAPLSLTVRGEVERILESFPELKRGL